MSCSEEGNRLLRLTEAAKKFAFFFFCILSNSSLNDSTLTHLIIPYQDTPG